MVKANVYNEILQLVKELDLGQQLRLIEEVAGLIRQQTKQGGSRSILELQGLGKEVWEGVDVKAYLEKEQASWND